jgi:probable rRNA maturation factor
VFEIEIIDSSQKDKLRKFPGKKIRDCVIKALHGENFQKAKVNLIFADDSFIKDMNMKYLGHDYETDVISFRLDDDADTLDGNSTEGEIYISIDTAARQAKEYNVSLTDELKRLAVHGALHLMGYDDDTDEKRQAMHDLENRYMKSQEFGVRS